MTRWGMAIDTDRCTGCGACVVACHAENNIQTVGEEEAARGRAMHWMRIDRYYSRDESNPEVFHMPVRLAKPKPLAGAMDLVDEPNFATSVGLLHYASEQQVDTSIKKTSRKKVAGQAGFLQQAKGWIMRNF